MLNLNLDLYQKTYTTEEKRALEDCFKQIQNYVRETIISKNPARRIAEYQLQYDSYSKAHLIIDCNQNQVYLKSGTHGMTADCYFIGGTKESSNQHFRYVLCTAVIDHWSTIKEELGETFGDCQSVLDLCKLFSV